MNILHALLIGAVTSGATYLALNQKKRKYKPAEFASENLQNSSDFYFNISNFSLKGAKKNSLGKDRFFYCYLKPDLKYHCTEIKLENELGALARIIYAEAKEEKEYFRCKIAAGEVVLNKLKSPVFKKRNYKTVFDVIKDRRWHKGKEKWFYQFDGYTGSKYNKTRIKIKNYLEKENFLWCVQSALIARFSGLDIVNGADFFSKNDPISDYYDFKEIKISCINRFFKAIKITEE